MMYILYLYMKQLESLCKQRGLKISHQNIWGLESSHESLSQILGSNDDDYHELFLQYGWLMKGV